MTNDIILFNKIKIGRKFKGVSDIVYRKISNVSAIPVFDIEGKKIVNGKKTSAFYNTSILLTPVV